MAHMHMYTHMYMSHDIQYIHTYLQSPISKASSSVENTSLLPTPDSSLSEPRAPIEEREDFAEIGSLPAADDTKQVGESG